MIDVTPAALWESSLQQCSLRPHFYKFCPSSDSFCHPHFLGPWARFTCSPRPLPCPLALAFSLGPFPKELLVGLDHHKSHAEAWGSVLSGMDWEVLRDHQLNWKGSFGVWWGGRVLGLESRNFAVFESWENTDTGCLLKMPFHYFIIGEMNDFVRPSSCSLKGRESQTWPF